MLVKFDSKSNRVKGLVFHPKLPWVAASLHNGVVQVWDYKIGVLLYKFEEHEGPVRGVDFHKTQPMLVSGGDDHKIKVYNYKQRRCLFTLLGHLDYIRTVQFHHEAPWIVSASDDQTIRIWNWMSRGCISVLTGHNHYVMSASFHPREDLVVSASLDQTVRVWDMSGLRRKGTRGAPSEPDSLSFTSRMNNDILFGGDAVVKYVLEGHDRGVNWAAFHPTQNLIVSGADDRQVKLWRMSDSKAWEMDTLRGHTNNVSCVAFHPKHDLVISDSEDRSIRVWDVQRRMCIDTYRRAADRFWILAIHPEQALVAAGHDSGMLVFKLERERPAYASLGGTQLFYCKDRFLRRAIMGPGGSGDVPLVSLRPRGGAGSSGSPLGTAPRTLLVNPHAPDELQVLLTSSVDGGTYELYSLAGASSDTEPVRGSCVAAAFTGRSKFAILDKSKAITVMGVAPGDPGKKIRPPYPNADFIFPSATAGRLIVRAEDRICLFELQSRRVVAEITSINAKYCVWSNDGSHVALLGKHTVVLADKDLTQITAVSETVRVKSGCWDNESGVFLYTTLNHVKYLLPLKNGESGIVRTLDNPVYAVEAKNNTMVVLDREARVKNIQLDGTEYLFKLALARGQFDKVFQIIKTARLCGQAVIAYLQKAGYPEIALFFVEDEETRFNLALECGNLDIALKAARALKSEAAWHKLAQEALRLGNFEVVEAAYQTTKALDKLSFLYLITGSSDKLNKMMAIASMRNDPQSRYHNALYCGNVEERVKVLESAGQLALAYTTAATYGIEADAARLKACLEEAGLPVPEVPAALSGGAGAAPPSLLLPPTPLFRNTGSWPLLKSNKGAFDPANVAAVAAAAKDATASVLAAVGGASGTPSAAAAAAHSAAAAAAAASVLTAAAEREAQAAAAAKKAALLAAHGGASSAAAASSPEEEAGGEGGGWGDEGDLDLGLDEGKKAAAGADAGEAGGAWGDDLDLGLDEADLAAAAAAPSSSSAAAAAKGPGGWAPPAGGTSTPAYWVSNSTLAADHVAAGSFETAMTLLNRQIGAVNFQPLKPFFTQVYQAARVSVPGALPGLPSLTAYLHRNEQDLAPPKEHSLPVVAITLPLIQDRLRALYKAFTDGKFSEAASTCDALFALIPLLVVNTKAEVAEVKAIVAAVTEYKLACRIMMVARSTDANDGVRQIELSAYMTHCALEPPHLMLAVNLAMAMAFKHKNFIHAAGFARRLLEMPDINSAKNAQLLTRAKAVLQKSEGEARNALKVNYDERTPFQICAGSLTPIYRGTEHTKSPYSGAVYTHDFKGTVCVVDGIAQVGIETLGLVSLNPSKK